ncbi:hypothetical protein Fmac_015506 [Flemingia macrophylla]|uniref:MLO-like protein n=1 Tax=Flemingia macrophylla TaxID=520843 RepID=A0ABD1MFN5_9FABA
MGLRNQDRGEVVKGAPVVEPGDDLFWFKRPRSLLFIIHLVLFQMGSTMKPAIFNDRVAAALKKWHRSAKKHVKDSKNSKANSTTAFSSRSSTPTFDISPVHLLHRHLAGRSDSPQTSPRTSNYENEKCDFESEPSTSAHPGTDETQIQVLEPPSTTELLISTEHEVHISSLDISFNTIRD